MAIPRGKFTGPDRRTALNIAPGSYQLVEYSTRMANGFGSVRGLTCQLPQHGPQMLWSSMN